MRGKGGQQPEAHSECELQSEAHSEGELQPEAHSEGELQPEAHSEGNLQPEAHSEGRRQPDGNYVSIRVPLLPGDINGVMTVEAATEFLDSTNIMSKLSKALSVVLTQKPQNTPGVMVAVLLGAPEGSELLLLNTARTDASPPASPPDLTETCRTLHSANAELVNQSRSVLGRLEESEEVNHFVRDRLEESNKKNAELETAKVRGKNNAAKALEHLAKENASAHLQLQFLQNANGELVEKLECLQNASAKCIKENASAHVLALKRLEANEELVEANEELVGQLEFLQNANAALEHKCMVRGERLTEETIATPALIDKLDEVVKLDETQLANEWTIDLSEQIDVLVEKIDELGALVKSRDAEISCLKVERDEVIAKSEEDNERVFHNVGKHLIHGKEQKEKMDRLGKDNLKLQELLASNKSEFDSLSLQMTQMKVDMGNAYSERAQERGIARREILLRETGKREMEKDIAAGKHEITCLKRVVEEVLIYVQSMDEIIVNRRLNASFDSACDMCGQTDEAKMGLVELQMQASHTKLTIWLEDNKQVFSAFHPYKCSPSYPEDQEDQEAGAKEVLLFSSGRVEPHVQLCDNVGCNVVLSAPISHCSKCKNVFYCTKACQTQAWKAGHKRECGHKLTKDQEAKLTNPTYMILTRNKITKEKAMFTL